MLFSLCFAVAKHVDAKLCRCWAFLRIALSLQLNAFPAQFHALLRRRGAVPYEPCRFSANQGHQCHAAAVSSGFGK
jgi:hypothetical protein